METAVWHERKPVCSGQGLRSVPYGTHPLIPGDPSSLLLYYPVERNTEVRLGSWARHSPHQDSWAFHGSVCGGVNAASVALGPQRSDHFCPVTAAGKEQH